ncbi:AMP-binding protein [Methylocystis sp. B8]|uniref:AMP-binding protein n=1 Tax=Methylocystis sp. B8 TaxID=544938 RepID=UPI0010FEFA90|nr:AMP-binding protein [Methylocystis sp. B8]TLG78870.1 acyl-phosphate glycerol 3-phosphate acyltransferase [Methylocystis sp. B8]
MPEADTGLENGASRPLENSQTAVLEVVRGLVIELHPDFVDSRLVQLDSDLDRDLALDSLSRAELLLRLNHKFKVQLPERLIGEANRPRDLVNAVLAAGAAIAPTSPRPASPTTLETVDEPIEAKTLIDALAQHAERHGDREHVLLWRPEGPPEPLTYGELYHAARAAAGGLIERGVSFGDRIAIMLPTSRDFFIAFFSVLFCGAVPVPIYPPFRLAQIEDHLRRQAGILSNAEASVLITNAEIRVVGKLLYGLVSALQHIVTIPDLNSAAPISAPLPAPPDATALIQYTSGSTGDPKGVVLSHANLLANIRAMGGVLKASSADRVVSWLPLYHDMGLIGCWLGSLYYGASALIMSPLSFLADPARWFWAIDTHKATISAAPNFAYELCLKAIDDAKINGLNLSSLRAIMNGAEPVSPTSLVRFAQRFAPYGFRPEMMTPVYGLAENAVGLAFPPPGRGPLIDRVDRKALDRDGIARIADPGVEGVISLVACGRPLPHHEIRVVDDASRELPERQEGRIQFRGPSATRGYFQNPEKTAALFDGDWLETGDRGYIAGGDIFITGRIKDLIKRAGRNIYPQELEEAVCSLEGARKGCVAAFAAIDARAGTERLIVLAETRLTDDARRESLRKRIGETSQALLDLAPDEVVLVPPHTIPKTSSGKIRRSAARAMFETGQLRTKGTSPQWQLVRVALSGVAPRLRRLSANFAISAYNAFAWSMLALIGAFVWPCVLLTPRRIWRHHLVGSAARLFFRLIGCPLTITRDTAVPQESAILIANHSSYLDSAVLVAVCPGELSFIAKEELAHQRVAGPFLRRLGAIFVRRTDPAGGVADARAALQSARAGVRLVWFPEGTFSRMPGLLGFHIGAFSTAAQLGLPVVPITIRGTRSILRSDSWLFRRGPIAVHIGAPIEPKGDDFQAAVALRDAARQKILERCGEPDLGHERVMMAG